MTHLLENVGMSIRRPPKQTTSKSYHFDFFTYVYRRKNTKKIKKKNKKKMPINHKKCDDSEYWKEKHDLNTILGVF